MDGTECTVEWASYYNGPVNVTLKVKGNNDCGDGEFSDEFVIEIENVGVSELEEALGLSIYPNPNKGTFTLELSTTEVDKVNLRIMNATGHLVYQENDMQVNSNFKSVIDISSQAEGIYLLMIESDLGLYTGRIIIQK